MMLRIEDLNAGYSKNNLILKDISLSVQKNEIIGIIGQNGAGKSTLAKSIIGLIPFVHGRIYFEGEQLVGKKTLEIVEMGINFFLQGGRIFPHLTIEENLMFAARIYPKSEVKNRIEEIRPYFSLFLDNKMKRNKLQASCLSGGEKHQLAIAMILIQKPKLLILDEPSAGLSPRTLLNVKKILILLKLINKASYILIEQNVQLANELSDSVTLLKNGKIEGTYKNKNLTEIEEIYFN